MMVVKVWCGEENSPPDPGWRVGRCIDSPAFGFHEGGFTLDGACGCGASGTSSL